MAGRRDMPPYEIMRLTAAKGSASPRAAGVEEGGVRGGRGEGGVAVRMGGGVVGRVRGWAGSLTDASPLVVRLPKGVALAALAAVVLSVLAAYFVGHWRGGAAAEMQWEATRRGLGLRADLSVPTRGSGQQAVGAAEERDDPRTPGLNYLHLAPNDFDKASRFSAFLQARGYATMLVPARNPPLQQVVVVRGFPGDSVEDRRDRERFQQRVMQLAGEYQAAGGDKYDYPPLYDRYDSPAPDSPPEPDTLTPPTPPSP